MTFCPEWLTGSANLDTENWLYLYVFLWLLNGLWVIVRPLPSRFGPLLVATVAR